MSKTDNDYFVILEYISIGSCYEKAHIHTYI